MNRNARRPVTRDRNSQPVARRREATRVSEVPMSDERKDQLAEELAVRVVAQVANHRMDILSAQCNGRFASDVLATLVERMAAAGDAYVKSGRTHDSRAAVEAMADVLNIAVATRVVLDEMMKRVGS